nr:peptidoglycan recognition protein [Charonia tritonis]
MHLAIILGLALFWQGADHYVDAVQCACATGNLNVRRGAGTNYTIVHTLAPGECLRFIGDSADAGGLTWYHLNYSSESAWAASNWLTVETRDACGTNTTLNDSYPNTTGEVQLPGCPRIITRAEWGARSPVGLIRTMPDLPIYVIIHHGAGGECFDKSSCIQKVRQYQNFHIDGRGWYDIGYNFVVGEDGNAYEGRGWTEIGAHTRGYNTNGIAISVIGDFTNHTPNAAALAKVRQLIQCGLDNRRISPSYTLKGHRDLGNTACPGDAYYNLIQSWPHFTEGTALYNGA